MNERTGGRKRSFLVLATAAVIGIGIGLLGAFLRPSPKPGVEPQALLFRAGQETPDLDLGKVQQALLERLVVSSAQTDKPEQLPDFLSFLRAFKRDPHQRTLLLERLGSQDVPPKLRLAFARRVPSQPAEQQRIAYQRLVLPLLRDSDPKVQLAAAEALLAGGQLETHRSPTCRCRFGHYLSQDGSAGSGLLAWTLEEGGRLSWSPTPLGAEPGGWDLRLKRSMEQDEGANVLWFVPATPLRGGQTITENSLASPHLVVKGAD